MTLTRFWAFLAVVLPILAALIANLSAVDLTYHLRAGEEIEVKITKIDDKGKIWLSRKALVKDPWAEARERYAPGTKHTGKVTRVEKFGVFVDLGEGFEGLIVDSKMYKDKLDGRDAVACAVV